MRYLEYSWQLQQEIRRMREIQRFFIVLVGSLLLDLYICYWLELVCWFYLIKGGQEVLFFLSRDGKENQVFVSIIYVSYV